MKYREELAQSLLDAMRNDPKVLILGESVSDPKGIFGTTLLAANAYPERVIEIPVSENMITGACLGLALEGWKPVLVHSRCEFMMVAMETMINSAAKWGAVHSDRPFTLVFRALIGRGWGQGPNHSQAFHSMFAHVPGFRVLYPVLPERVEYWMNEALSWNGPTVIFEPRRMYDVESLEYPIWDDPDIYIVTFGDIVIDAAVVALELKERGIKAQVHPVEDVSALELPVENKPTIIADTAHLAFGASAEVAARLAERGNISIKRVGPPFMPLPTSAVLEKNWYPTPEDLLAAAYDLLGIKPEANVPAIANSLDDSFKGPF